MSELAAGFRAGTQMAQSALDAYDRSKRAGEEAQYRAELKRINDERNLKALGIDTSGGIGINPTRGMTVGDATIPGVNPVPGIAQGGATIPGVNQVPEIGLGMPGEGQPFTGFTGGAAQLAESLDPNYGLSQKMALAEQYGMDKDYARYLGQKDRVAEIERAEQAERQRQYEAGLGRTYQLERDEVKDTLDNRVQTRLEGVASQQKETFSAQQRLAEYKLNQLTNEQDRTQATEIASNALTDIMAKSRDGVPDLAQVNAALEQNEFLNSKPGLLAAAKYAASRKYFGDLGINELQQTRIFSQATMPLREALSKVPVDEEGNALGYKALPEFQKVINSYHGFDSDPTDNVTPKLVIKDDGSIGVFEGKDNETKNFANFNELMKYATSQLEKADNSMANTTLQYMDTVTKIAKAQAARLEDQAAREEAFRDFVKQNAALSSSEVTLKKFRAIYRVGETLPDWNGGDPDQPQGLSIEEAMNQFNQNQAANRKGSADFNQAVNDAQQKYSEEEIDNLLTSNVGLGDDSRAVLIEALDRIKSTSRVENKKKRKISGM